jgi:hypothetical protein
VVPSWAVYSFGAPTDSTLPVVLLPQIFLWSLKDNDLTGMAFIDTQLHIHQMFSIKNFILAADLMKSVSLLRYQTESKTLSLVSRVGGITTVGMVVNRRSRC